MSAHGGGVVASGEGPETSCAFKLGHLLHVRLKSTGVTCSCDKVVPMVHDQANLEL